MQMYGTQDLITSPGNDKDGQNQRVNSMSPAIRGSTFDIIRNQISKVEW